MRCKSLLVLWCIVEWLAVVHAVCTLSKYDGGTGVRVQCSNTSLSMALDQGTAAVSAFMIVRSELQQIRERAFVRHAGTLVTLNINQCNITEIHRDAFLGLVRLKKLNLQYNKIAEVKEGWFNDLRSLEQLDLSFNAISKIEPIVLSNLHLLRRLDVGENRLTCFEPAALAHMGAIEKFRFTRNPLNFLCRGKLTLWLRDHGVNYKGDEKEIWLDSLLWLCAFDNQQVAESEEFMEECVILNLFNQLRTGLVTAQSYPLQLPQECVYSRNLLLNCLDRHPPTKATNGHIMKQMLLTLRASKSAR